MLFYINSFKDKRSTIGSYIFEKYSIFMLNILGKDIFRVKSSSMWIPMFLGSMELFLKKYEIKSVFLTPFSFFKPKEDPQEFF